jgi:TATA-binding protein-associated factor Taf7
MPQKMRRQITGIRFSKKQLSQMQAIWDHEVWSKTDLVRSIWPRLRGASEDFRDGIEDEETESEEVYKAAEGDEDGEEEEGEEIADDDDESSADEEDNQGDEDEYQEEDEPETREGSATMNWLLELVFQLSVTFSTEEFMDSQPSSSLLVYFSRVLGFSPDSRNFSPAKRFALCLSGLIYI